MKENIGSLLTNKNLVDIIDSPHSIQIYLQDTKNMKVLLTGGSGFLGKHCLDSLLKYGFENPTE